MKFASVIAVAVAIVPMLTPKHPLKISSRYPLSIGYSDEEHRDLHCCEHTRLGLKE
jgi:hypothetical protein